MGLLDPPGLSSAEAALKYTPTLVNPERQVATNVFYSGLSTLNTVASTCRSVHYAAVDCYDLRIGYGNMAMAGTTPVEVDGVNTYTVRAALETSDGRIFPLTFGGLRSVTIDGGGFALTDPMGVDLTAGTKFFVRTYISATGTGWNATNRTYSTNGCGGMTAGDLTAVGSAAVPDSDSYIYSPHLIIGRPVDGKAVSVVILGDSIAGGQGDGSGVGVIQEMVSGGTIGRGFFHRALGTTGFGRVSLAFPNATVKDFVIFDLRRRMRAAAYTRHALSCFGRNDIAIRTSAQIKGDLLTVFTMFRRRGPKVWQTTITPRTASTDGWATVANQTVASAAEETKRLDINTWLRDGAPVSGGAVVAAGTAGASRAAVYSATGSLVTAASGPAGHPLAGVFDTTDAVETARDSGIWKAAYSTDGIHPSGQAHIAMAAAIPTSVLTYF